MEVPPQGMTGQMVRHGWGAVVGKKEKKKKEVKPKELLTHREKAQSEKIWSKMIWTVGPLKIYCGHP